MCIRICGSIFRCSLLRKISLSSLLLSPSSLFFYKACSLPYSVDGSRAASVVWEDRLAFPLLSHFSCELVHDVLDECHFCVCFWWCSETSLSFPAAGLRQFFPTARRSSFPPASRGSFKSYVPTQPWPPVTSAGTMALCSAVSIIAPAAVMCVDEPPGNDIENRHGVEVLLIERFRSIELDCQ